jgi:hypothetical protein
MCSYSAGCPYRDQQGRDGDVGHDDHRHGRTAATRAWSSGF